ncbi:MAG: ABC transporter ATP-binding protein [Lachnospiraceae bacterium]|nr:ABC transporter ATP-binding protein [Lachnospiraceae bacterium]
MKNEKMKMGVGKSICYMLKTIWNADKGCVIYSFYKNCTEEVFSSFFVITMMQIIYGYIENGKPYLDLVKFVLLFCSLHICIHLASAGHAYYIRLKTPKVYGHVFNKVIEKATHIELTRYEQPDFYDQFSKALDECLTKAMEGLRLFTWAVGCFLSTIAAMLIVAKSDPVILIFSGISVITSFLCGSIINRYQYQLREEETKDKRTMEYVKRVFYEKKYAGEIRLYSIRELLFGKYAKSLDSLCEINKRLYRKIIFYRALQNILLFGITCLCTYLYVAFVIKTTGVRKIGMYVALVGSIDYISWRIKATVKNFVDAGKTCVYMNNLENFLAMQTEEKDDRRKVMGELGDISVNHLNFTYTGADMPVIQDLSLQIKKGERIALVGENGAGKTTFVKLLMGLYPVSKGSILIDGVDIGEYNSKDYHSHFGTVFQDLQVFALPLSHNVLMKEPENEEERQLVIQSLEKAQFGETLRKLPQGIDTILTKEFDDNGLVCSGGQAQKVAIARVFAKNPDIVILDEPSSALDPIAEYNMYRNMMQVSEGKTVFFISHRMSSARIADRIFFLEQGHVAESGTHNELMAQDGKYAKMFRLQAKNYRDKNLQESLLAREVFAVE